MSDLPKINSLWVRKKTGDRYRVQAITNVDASPDRRADRPIRVVYKGQDGSFWDKELGHWYESMEPWYLKFTKCKKSS